MPLIVALVAADRLMQVKSPTNNTIAGNINASFFTKTSYQVFSRNYISDFTINQVITLKIYNYFSTDSDKTNAPQKLFYINFIYNFFREWYTIIR